MIPYIVILLLFLMGFNAKKKKSFFFLCSLCMLLVAALRAANVGTDTITYMDYFRNEMYTHPLEPLWDDYMQLVRSVTDNPQIFIALNASITLIPLFVLFYYFNKPEFAIISLFVYFILPSDQGFIFSMSGMRQAMAATIVMFEFLAFEKRKWFWFIILIAAAFLIHNSSFIAGVGVLTVSIVRINPKTGFILLIVSVVFMVLSVSVADVFTLLHNTPLMQLEFIEDYSEYSNYLIGGYHISFFGTINLVFPIIQMSILLLLNPNVLESLYARLYLLGAFFVCAMSQVPMISRYFLYFIMLEAFLIPQLFSSRSFKYNRLFCMILLTYQTIILFLYLYFNNASGLDWDIRRVTPYYFFFNAPYNFY